MCSCIYSKTCKDGHGDLDTGKDSNPTIGYFHAACINSVNKTPVEHDIIIVDEAIVNLGNLFMQTAKAFYNETKASPVPVGDGEEKEEVKMSENSWHRYGQAVEADKACLQGTIERLRKASILFYVDAAFTHASMKALESLYHDCNRVPLNEWLQGVDNRNVRIRLRAQTQGHDHVFCNYYQETTRVHIAPVRKIALYDPDRHHGVFTRIEHYREKADLVNELVRELLEERKKNIVYVSSSRTAQLLARDVDVAIKSRSSLVPSIGVLSAETVEKDQNSYIVLKDKLDKVVLAIVTTIVSCGLSFTQPNYFDTAYAFVELGRGLPPPADMIQLSARVRSLSTKVLKYNVVCSGPICNLLVRLYEEARRRDLIRDTTVYNYHDANTEEFRQANEMASIPALARVIMKQMFVNAFTHITDRNGSLFVPTAVDVVNTGPNRYLPTRGSKLKYAQMCKQLPESHVVIGRPLSKRPIKRSWDQLSSEECMPCQKYARVAQKDGAQDQGCYSSTHSREHYVVIGAAAKEEEDEEEEEEEKEQEQEEEQEQEQEGEEGEHDENMDGGYLEPRWDVSD